MLSFWVEKYFHAELYNEKKIFAEILRLKKQQEQDIWDTVSFLTKKRFRPVDKMKNIFLYFFRASKARN